jgi:hypothetical protein
VSEPMAIPHTFPDANFSPGNPPKVSDVDGKGAKYWFYFHEVGTEETGHNLVYLPLSIAPERKGLLSVEPWFRDDNHAGGLRS